MNAAPHPIVMKMRTIAFHFNHALDSLPPLADTCALVGGAGRGSADQESDLDLNCWADALPDPADAYRWLDRCGVREISATPQVRADGSIAFTGRFRAFRLEGEAALSGDFENATSFEDFPIEVTWQTWTDLESEIAALTSGAVLDRDRLALAELLVHAYWVRGHERGLAAIAPLRAGPPDAVLAWMDAQAAAAPTPAEADDWRWLIAHREWPPKKAKTVAWLRARARA